MYSCIQLELFMKLQFSLIYFIFIFAEQSELQIVMEKIVKGNNITYFLWNYSLFVGEI